MICLNVLRVKKRCVNCIGTTVLEFAKNVFINCHVASVEFIMKSLYVRAAVNTCVILVFRSTKLGNVMEYVAMNLNRHGYAVTRNVAITVCFVHFKVVLFAKKFVFALVHVTVVTLLFISALNII